MTTDIQLLMRAINDYRFKGGRRGTIHPRWVAVGELFDVKEGAAIEICRRFQFDPEEWIR